MLRWRLTMGMRSTHKLTRYELSVIRAALKKYAPETYDETNKMTAWMLFDRLWREYCEQRGAEGEN